MFWFLWQSTDLASAKITGKPVNRGAGFRMEVICLYEFWGDSFNINWVHMKIEGKKKCIIEACKTWDKTWNRVGLCACDFTTYKNWGLLCCEYEPV